MRIFLYTQFWSTRNGLQNRKPDCSLKHMTKPVRTTVIAYRPDFLAIHSWHGDIKTMVRHLIE